MCDRVGEQGVSLGNTDNLKNEKNRQNTGERQGGKTCQPFVGSKNDNENFRQARIYNFRVKCVVFVCNRKFANLCNIHHAIVQFLPKKHCF